MERLAPQSTTDTAVQQFTIITLVSILSAVRSKFLQQIRWIENTREQTGVSTKRSDNPIAKKVPDRSSIYLVKVEHNAPDIRRPNRNHGEESITPLSQQDNPLVQHEQILQLLHHPW